MTFKDSEVASLLALVVALEEVSEEVLSETLDSEAMTSSVEDSVTLEAQVVFPLFKVFRVEEGPPNQ